MGWSGALVLVNQGAPGAIVGSLRSDSAQACRIARAIEGRPRTPSGETTLEEAFSLGDDGLAVGAYGASALIASWPLVERLFEKPDEVAPWAPLTNLFPGARMLAIGLVSATNYYGYAWFEGGRVCRARAGNAEDGMYFEIGDPLPEELPLLENSIVRDGERFFPGEDADEEQSNDQMGEEFVFALCRPFFGVPFDQIDDEQFALPLHEFAEPRRDAVATRRPPVRRSWWRRLFG